MLARKNVHSLMFGRKGMEGRKVLGRKYAAVMPGRSALVHSGPVKSPLEK